MNRPFDNEKAVEAIVYISTTMPRNNSTLYIILKLMYLADKLHLERYGRQITCDNYVAMQHGPVPSGAYDIVKSVRSGSGYSCFGDHPKRSFSVENKVVTPLRKPILELLSDSEIEVFDDVIKQYGNYGFAAIRKVSHDEAYKKADENDTIELADICRTLKNGDLLVKHLNDPCPN